MLAHAALPRPTLHIIAQCTNYSTVRLPLHNVPTMPILKHTLPTVAQLEYIRPSLPMYSLPNIWDAIWPHVLVVHPGNACSLCAQAADG